jgi:hypothetical protein
LGALTTQFENLNYSPERLPNGCNEAANQTKAETVLLTGLPADFNRMELLLQATGKRP